MWKDAKKIIEKYYAVHHMSIRRKLTVVVLSISTITLLILSAITFYGMLGAKEIAVRVGSEIGAQSVQNSAELMEAEKKTDLVDLAMDKADDIDRRLKRVVSIVRVAAMQMEEIQNHPQRFLPQDVSTDVPDKPGDIAFYLQYGPDTDVSALQDEIRMAANIQDYLKGVVSENWIIESIFVASEKNYTLSGEVVDEGNAAVQSIYDAVGSDWYRKAALEKKPIYTDVRRFVFSGKMGVFCAVPCYGSDGNLLGVAGIQSSVERLTSVIRDLKLYNEGFCFVVDNRGYVILSSREKEESDLRIDLATDLRSSANSLMSDAAKKMVAGECGVTEVEIDGEDYYVAYAPISQVGWSFAAAIARDDVMAPIVMADTRIRQLTGENIESLDRHMERIMLLMALSANVLLLGVIYIGRRSSDRFVEPIRILSDGVQEIAGGNIEKKISIHTGDEIEHLAGCFNDMTDKLHEYMKNLQKITAERERTATELSVAANIQESMLPNEFPPFPDRKEFDIYAGMHAAKQVGGDFYDFYLVDENHVMITIADVSGKGVPAALFMVIAKTILKNFAMTIPGESGMAALVACANNTLCENNDAMMFVTAFIGMLDIRTGRFTYVNAGHNPPLIYRAAEGRFQYICETGGGHVLGAMEDMKYNALELTLLPGDALFLYTDGVTEAIDEKEEQYGEARLEASLNRVDMEHSTPEDILKEAHRSLEEYVGDAEQFDDITMMALSYRGKE